MPTTKQSQGLRLPRLTVDRVPDNNLPRLEEISVHSAQQSETSRNRRISMVLPRGDNDDF